MSTRLLAAALMKASNAAYAAAAKGDYSEYNEPARPAQAANTGLALGGLIGAAPTNPSANAQLKGLVGLAPNLPGAGLMNSAFKGVTAAVRGGAKALVRPAVAAPAPVIPALKNPLQRPETGMMGPDELKRYQITRQPAPPGIALGHD